MTETVISLRQGALALTLDRRGGVITRFTWDDPQGMRRPLMRTARDAAGDPLKAACFPLLPFGSRVAGNRFSVGAETYTLAPNHPGDRHYLHGDGWLGLWIVDKILANAVTLAFRHEAQAGQPYDYEARMSYHLSTDATLAVQMEIRNRGDRALPFGIGLHPYFPLTPQTTLFAPAASFFPEAADFLPGPRSAVPPALDFAQPRRLPHRWINNGFAGWTGEARITWPEAGLALRIIADAGFRHYVLFRPDGAFDPTFAGDYVCFEPMTHQPNGHHAADFGGLTLLAPGAVLQGSILFTPEAITS
ncbi:aldose 1-epimerase [Acidisoma sp. 7E03]